MVFRRLRTGSRYHIRFTMPQNEREIKRSTIHVALVELHVYEKTKRDFVCEWVVSVDL